MFINLVSLRKVEVESVKYIVMEFSTNQVEILH